MIPGVQDLIENFVDYWGPEGVRRHQFIEQLREILETYGKAALVHQSLPDTEHGHGEPL
jgi:hypothetical protein